MIETTVYTEHGVAWMMLDGSNDLKSSNHSKTRRRHMEDNALTLTHCKLGSRESKMEQERVKSEEV